MKGSVYILGGTGFIGRNLVEFLTSQGYPVSYSGRASSSPFPSSATYLSGGFGSESLREEAGNVETLFIVACPTKAGSHPGSLNDELAEHVMPVVSFMGGVDMTKLKRVIYISSGGTVYLPKGCEKYSEDSELGPVSNYGIAKVTLELFITRLCDSSGVALRIARPANPIGRYQSFGGGQGVVPVIVGSLKNGESFNVFGDGSVVRDYFDVRDLVRGLEKLIDYDGGLKHFNFGSGNSTSIMELIGFVESSVGGRLEIVRQEFEGFHAPWSVLNSDRASRELGWNCEFSISDSVGDYLKHL